MFEKNIEMEIHWAISNFADAVIKYGPGLFGQLGDMLKQKQGVITELEQKEMDKLWDETKLWHSHELTYPVPTVAAPMP